MANPNIANLLNIYGTTNVVSSVAISTGSTVIASVPTATVYKVESVIAANKTSSNATITLYVTRSAVNYNVAYQMVVPVNATLVLVGKDSFFYMNESDVLTAVAGTASAIDIVASFEAIS
jgi:hypothetical protein